MAADEHTLPRARAPGKAVGVAHRHDRRPHGPRGDEFAAVTHRVAGRQVHYLHHQRLPREGGLKAGWQPALVHVRVEPVEGDAAARQIQVALRHGEQRSRVGGVGDRWAEAGCGQILEKALE